MPLAVAVVGDALMDVTIAPAEPMRPGGDVPAIVRFGPGGQGANVAVRLARRGATTRLAGALGDDAAGRLLREALEVDGVRIEAAAMAATGAAAILLAPGGERTMLSQRVPLLPHVDLAALTAGVDWLVISGYALLEDGALAFARRCAAQQPLRAILGCAVPDARVADWRAAASAARAHLVVLNADEARVLAGADDELEALVAALALELGAAVIVTGPRRASAVAGDIRVTVAAPTDSAGVVDTTGAGDAFAAALIVGLGVAWPPDADALGAAMSDALSIAGEVVGVPGAQGPIASERGGASG
ncbi:MAG TPA: carbohydrate kinase family protein [Candidatus Limnocylindria bacterium]